MPEFSASEQILPDWGSAFNQGALQGVETQKAVGGLNALRGIDFNDPQSINNAFTNSVKSGNLDQANALIGIQQTRTVLPILNEALKGALQQPSSSEQPDYTQQHADMGNHAAETLNMAISDLKDLKKVPPEQRLDATEALTQKYKDRGLPAQSVAEELSDVSDAGINKKIADYTQMAQHYSNVASGQPSTWQYTGGNLPQWAIDTINNNKLNNPVVQGAFKKYLGVDLEPQLQRAIQLAMPGIQKSTELQYAAPIAAATEGAKLPYTLAEKLGEHVQNLQLMDADALAAAKKAGATATAEEAAKAPFDFMTMKGPGGQDVYVRKDYALGNAGEHGGVLGQSIQPAEQEFRTKQAEAAAKVLEPDAKARQDASYTKNEAERAIGIIDKYKFNQATPLAKQVSDALRTAGFKGAEQYSTDLAGYQQLGVKALTAGARAAFPQRVTDRDLKLIQPAFTSLTTPNDQARVVFGMQAAKALRDQQYEDFKANYTGPHDSPGAIQAEWLKREGGQSIFQSPEWANIKIGGRPAFDPATDVKEVNGKKIGAWGIGTGHPVYFEVH